MIPLDIIFFLKGLLVGIAISIPIGPMGILCIRRSLTKGKMAGIISGLGVATADGIFAFIAAFGLSIIANFISAHHTGFKIATGIFLIVIGMSIYISKPESQTTSWRYGFWGTYFSAFFLTLSNPLTILFFIALFATLGLPQTPYYIPASLLTLGVFCGASIWWVILSSIIHILRKKITIKTLENISKLTGVGITLIGTLTFLSAFF